MPSILEGYCAKSNQPREIAEEEAKEFLQVIEDSASYQFGYNHSIAYCLLGYLCAYFRYYHPIEFITAFLNDAANDEDIRNGTILAKQRGITIVPPKFGISRSDYFFTKEKRVIAKGLSSVKYMGKAVVDELYALSKRQYATFTDLLWTLSHHSSLDSRQLDILIKIDFFSDFGNQRELFQIVSLFDLFKKGEAKQLKKERAAALGIEDIVAKYANGTTKSGKESKSYTLLFPMTILRECEQRFLTVGALGNFEVMDLFGLINEDELGYKSYSDAAVSFTNKILDTINDVKDHFPCDFSFNLEMIPAENCAGVICAADNLLFEQNKYSIYSNQWEPLTAKCTIQEKCRLGSLFDKKCGGGCIAHIDIENRFPNEEAAWDMLNYVASQGVIYFAFTTKISVCEDKHAFIGTTTCPVCGKPVADTYARVVGFYTPVSSYQEIRKQEFSQRKWYNVLNKNEVM